jgi:hypothetical protein
MMEVLAEHTAKQGHHTSGSPLLLILRSLALKVSDLEG